MKRKAKVAGVCAVLVIVTVFGFLTWSEKSSADKAPRSQIMVGSDGKLVVLRPDTWAAVYIVADKSILTNWPQPTPNLRKNR
jgi:hypothetical protein